MRAAVSLAILLVGFAPARDRAQSSVPPPDDRFTFEFRVFDRQGLAVPDLTKEQVELRIDGRVHAPSAFEYRRSPAMPRQIVVVVDRGSMPEGGGRALLDAARRFVEGPARGDRVALWILQESRGALAFGADRTLLAKSLASATGIAPVTSGAVRLSRAEAALVDAGDSMLRRAVLARVCGDRPAARAECERAMMADVARILRAARAHSRPAFSALRDVIHALRTVDGPKHVILLTGGIHLHPDLLPAAQELALVAFPARVMVHTIQVPPSHSPNGVASAATIPAWAADPDVTSAASSLALATGGFNSSTLDPDEAFDRLSRQIAGTYTATLGNASRPRDGRLRQLGVKVLDRQDVFVRVNAIFQPYSGLSRAIAGSSDARVEVEPFGSRDITTPVDQLVSRAGAYAQRFEQAIPALVAEEHYVQLSKAGPTPPPGPRLEPALAWNVSPKSSRSTILASRNLRSDALMIQGPEGRWAHYRDVIDVDRAPVRVRDAADRPLRGGAPPAQTTLRTMGGEGGAHHLGAVRRAIDGALIPLLYIHPHFQPRMRFSSAGADTLDGQLCALVDFTETQAPSVAAASGGRDAPAAGRVWIEPDSGRILKIQVRFEGAGVSSGALEVTFGHEEGFDLLLPRRVWEWYAGAAAGEPYLEAQAMYSSFRKPLNPSAERAK
jgi:hypothetical protein